MTDLAAVLSTAVVLLGAALLFALWRLHVARGELADSLVRLLDEAHDNKALREELEQKRKEVRALEHAARTAPITLADLPDGVEIHVYDIGGAGGHHPQVHGRMRGSGHWVYARLRTPERVKEAVLAAADGRWFVVPISDITEMEGTR